MYLVYASPVPQSVCLSHTVGNPTSSLSTVTAPVAILSIFGLIDFKIAYRGSIGGSSGGHLASTCWLSRNVTSLDDITRRSEVDFKHSNT